MPLYGGITLPDRPDPSNIQRLDLLPVPMACKMMRYGMRIDLDHFSALSSKLNSRMKELRREITDQIPPADLDRFMEISEGDQEDENGEVVEPDTIPPEFNVESGAKIAALLYDVFRLHLTDGVKVKKTKGGDRLSTGKKTLEQFKRVHPIAKLILDYRECSKLDGTYAKAMPRKACLHPRGKDCPVCGRFHYTDEWRVHTKILLTRTASGRTASKDPNLANIPARSELGREIRAGFIPSDGCVLVQRDYAQIELRLMADRSGDARMIAVYEEDGDIHISTAMGTFGLTDPSQVDKLLHRAPSKNTNFAVCYLITGDGLLDLMASTFSTANKPLPDHMTSRWCSDFIDKWFGLYKGVRVYLDVEEEKVRRYGFCWTAAGRVRRVPEVRSYHEYIQSAGVRQACNHGIQGFSADIMKLTMGEVQQQLDVLERSYAIESWPLVTIYDELLVEAQEDNAETVQAVMEGVMDHVLDDKQTGERLCRVPIKSDGKNLKRWTKE